MFDRPPTQIDAAGNERVDQFRGAAQRVLKELFNLDVAGTVISDNTTLLDFAEDAAEDACFSRVWAECIKQQVFARFGIACEAHEPLVDVLARLETAERGPHDGRGSRASPASPARQ
jgi:hypothetical protein